MKKKTQKNKDLILTFNVWVPHLGKHIPIKWNVDEHLKSMREEDVPK